MYQKTERCIDNDISTWFGRFVSVGHCSKADRRVNSFCGLSNNGPMTYTIGIPLLVRRWFLWNKHVHTIHSMVFQSSTSIDNFTWFLPVVVHIGVDWPGHLVLAADTGRHRPVGAGGTMKGSLHTLAELPVCTVTGFYVVCALQWYNTRSERRKQSR